MQFRDGADVLTATGEKIGRVDRVVLDPRTKEVTHLVVRKGLLLTTDKVLPVAMVSQATDEAVTLNRNVSDPKELPDFEETHYVNVDEYEWNRRRAVGSAPGRAAAQSYVPAMYWYPPTGVMAPGLAAAATVPYYEMPAAQAETTQNIPGNTVALKEGADVVSADGEKVGSVERVFADSGSNRATHLLVSQGVLFQKHKPVPTTWIEEVTEDEVRLAVSADLLKGLREYADSGK
jgi:uncharacterized protein YrrD